MEEHFRYRYKSEFWSETFNLKGWCKKSFVLTVQTEKKTFLRERTMTNCIVSILKWKNWLHSKYQIDFIVVFMTTPENKCVSQQRVMPFLTKTFSQINANKIKLTTTHCLINTFFGQSDLIWKCYLRYDCFVRRC